MSTNKWVNVQKIPILKIGYKIPESWELDLVREGYFVKITNEYERVWVKVTKREGNLLEGIIQNVIFHLLDDEIYNKGDLVQFHPENILDIN